jgi:hypothetical protein
MVAFCFACLALLGGVEIAHAAGWEKLGEKRVDDKTERDEIRVGIGKGTYRWLKLRVEDHAVEFDRVIVTYGNGDRQSIPIRRIIRGGDESRPIRVENAPRVIRSVVFYYKTIRDGKRAKVKLYARD